MNKKIKIYDRNKISDSRGWFMKVITGKEELLPNHTGEVYITVAIAGEMKGGHYHIMANEWFTLIKGKCELVLIDIDTNELQKIVLDAENPQTIFVSPKLAHAFYNIGDSEFILLAYTDVLYDPRDTIQYDFSNIKYS